MTRVVGDDAASSLSSTTFGGGFSTLSAVLLAHEFCQPSHYSLPEGSSSAANVQRNKNMSFSFSHWRVSNRRNGKDAEEGRNDQIQCECHHE